MSGRPRTTSFAEQNKQNQQPAVLGMKVTSKYMKFPPLLKSIIDSEIRVLIKVIIFFEKKIVKLYGEKKIMIEAEHSESENGRQVE